MGTAANPLTASVISGPNSPIKTSAGVKVTVPVGSDVIAPLKFRLDENDLGLTYDSTNDKVFIVGAVEGSTTYEANSYSYELTRTGSLWEYTPDSTHFGACGIRPGATRDMDAWIVLQRDGGAGAFKRETSARFTLTVDRPDSFSLNEVSGLNGWWRGWDLVDDFDHGDAVGTWIDRSLYGRDFYEATNTPLMKYDAQGRPCLKFDGSNDKLTTIIRGDTGNPGNVIAPFTFFALCRVREVPGTAKSIARLGATVPVDLQCISTGSAGLTGLCTATSTAAVTLTDGLFFLATVTKAAAGAVTVYHNLTAGSGAGTAANTAGPIVIGSDGTTFVEADLMECASFNVVLSAGNLDKVQRYLCSLGGVNL